jgi:preprotein translocase subunit SecG
MLRIILTAIQVLSSFAIIGLVLIQRGKGAEAGAGFGAGASGTVFGARGASTALSKATALFAAIFMINSLALAYTGTRASEQPKSILEEAGQPQPKPAPGAALPVTPPPSRPAGGAAPGSVPPATPAPAASAARTPAQTPAQKPASPPPAPAPSPK